MQDLFYIMVCGTNFYMNFLMTKPTKWLCAQSDQSLRCLHDESLGP